MERTNPKKPKNAKAATQVRDAWCPICNQKFVNGRCPRYSHRNIRAYLEVDPVAGVSLVEQCDSLEVLNLEAAA